jgi:methylated-DNA-[protein]-cysteine S-methyltransferase
MTVFESPIGPMTIAVNEAGALEEIRFGVVKGIGVAPANLPAKGGKSADADAGRIAGATRIAAGTREVIRQLEDYFRGKRRDFELTLAPRGTEFQLACWGELQRIAYGSTISYGELARRIGKPSAVRAVGAANGANPIPVVIPCHRVIGANGTLVGYGGGLHIKRALLAIEQPQRALLETA